MLKYQIRTVCLENGVADHIESYFECDNCKGTGTITIDKVDLIDRMEGHNFAVAIKMYRDWKFNNHDVSCTECGGVGYWVDRI